MQGDNINEGRNFRKRGELYMEGETIGGGTIDVWRDYRYKGGTLGRGRNSRYRKEFFVRLYMSFHRDLYSCKETLNTL